MPRSPQSLQRIIASDALLAAWQARRTREEALTAMVRRHLPRQLGDRLRAGESATGELEILASAGAVAAAVRQRAPDLLHALQRDGWPCTAVRVRVQVGAPPAPITRSAPALPDRADVAPLVTLAGELPPGPLKVALSRLVRRLGGRGV